MNHGFFVQTKQGFEVSYEMLLEGRKYASAQITKDVFHVQLHFDSTSGWRSSNHQKKYIRQRL